MLGPVAVKYSGAQMPLDPASAISMMDPYFCRLTTLGAFFDDQSSLQEIVQEESRRCPSFDVFLKMTLIGIRKADALHLPSTPTYSSMSEVHALLSYHSF